MINIKKAVAAGLVSGALTLSSFLTPAFAATTLTISGNGSGSDNDADVDITRTNTLVQDNVANIRNDVSVNADTGNNDANDNTGGDVDLTSGDIDASVSILNHANHNFAVGNCCPNGQGGSVEISGNGSDSDNDADVDITNVHSVFQTNDADVDNDVDVDADTGNNDANDNTGGDVTLESGDIDVGIGIWTFLNKNHASVGGGNSSASNGGWDLRISGNGSDSDNDIDLDLTNVSTLVQDNVADVDNDVRVDADTGNNDANDNTGGDVDLTSGDIDADVEVLNQANINHASLSCGCPADGLLAKIFGNGSDSDNTINADLVSVDDKFQTNDADFDNDLRWLNADTGDNDVEDNTGDPGGDPSLTSGDADMDVSVANAANINAASDGSSLGNIDFDFDLSEVLGLLLGL